MTTRPLLHRRGLLALMGGTVLATGAIGSRAWAGPVVARAGDHTLTIEFDSALNSRLISGLAGQAPALTDFAASETVTLDDDRIIDTFAFVDQSRAAIRNAHGQGVRHVVRGVSAEGLEKTVTLSFYERYPASP